VPETIDVEADAEGTEDFSERNEVVYLAGRVYCEVSKKTNAKKWIYERWNKTVTS
jgi:hypothetical protein